MPTRPCRILVCFAVRQEAAVFQRSCPDDVATLITGMGPGPAAAAAETALAQHRPRLLVTAGFAGALRPGLPAGTVLFDADADFPFVDALRAAGARPATFFTQARVATTAREKRELHAASHADAVEMESGVIRSMCRDRGVPAATVRVISDEAEEDLPLDFNAFMTEAGTLAPGRMAAGILRRPASIPGLMRLGRRTAAAAEALGRVLLAVCQARG